MRRGLIVGLAGWLGATLLVRILGPWGLPAHGMAYLGTLLIGGVLVGQSRFWPRTSFARLARARVSRWDFSFPAFWGPLLRHWRFRQFSLPCHPSARPCLRQ